MTIVFEDKGHCSVLYYFTINAQRIANHCCIEFQPDKVGASR